jgi:hypothetical protein
MSRRLSLRAWLTVPVTAIVLYDLAKLFTAFR